MTDAILCVFLCEIAFDVDLTSLQTFARNIGIRFSKELD